MPAAFLPCLLYYYVCGMYQLGKRREGLQCGAKDMSLCNVNKQLLLWLSFRKIFCEPQSESAPGLEKAPYKIGSYSLAITYFSNSRIAIVFIYQYVLTSARSKCGCKYTDSTHLKGEDRVAWTPHAAILKLKRNMSSPSTCQIFFCATLYVGREVGEKVGRRPSARPM